MMAVATPETIVVNAVIKGELDKLLLGMPGYQYRSRYSPAPGNTDLTELLDVVYHRLDPETRAKASQGLLDAIYSIIGTYQGLRPTASCLLYEVSESFRGKPVLGLPVDLIATKLAASIRAFEPKLRADKSGGGRGWPDGMLGDFRRLSGITEKYGGPPFCK